MTFTPSRPLFLSLVSVKWCAHQGDAELIGLQDLVNLQHGSLSVHLQLLDLYAQDSNCLDCMRLAVSCAQGQWEACMQK